MPAYVSPGVYVIEKDWSDYTPSLNSTSVGILGFASTGPVGEATLITNQDQLISTFGPPQDAEGGQGLIGAYHILERTNTVYFTRCATVSAVVADVAVPIGTAPYVDVTGIAANSHYLFLVSATDGDGITVTPDWLQFNVTPASADSSMVGGANAVEALVNLRTTPTSPVQFVAETSSTGDFIGTYAGSGAQISVYCISSANSFGTLPPGASLAELSALSGQNVDLTSISLSGNQIMATPNTGYTAPGAAAVAAQSSAVEFNATSLSGGAYVTRTLYPGAGYNYSSTVETYGLKVTGLQNTTAASQGANSTFNLNRGGGMEESHIVNLTQNTSGTSLNPEKVINNTSDKSNKTSEYIIGEFAVDLSSRDDVLWTLPTVWGGVMTGMASGDVYGADGAVVAVNMTIPKYWKLKNGTYNYVGGVNGDLGDGSKSFSDPDVKAAVIGNGADGNGIYSFLKEDIDISLLAVPGCTEQNIVNNAVTLAESSQEYLFVSNPPLNITSPQNAIAWSNGNGEGRTASLNSSYACVYWPWVKLFNTFTRVDEYVSPDVFAIRQMAFTDNNFDAWIAPAGLVKGRLTKPVDVEIVLTQGDRDALYGAGNCINPIQKFATDGIVIWGQRTTQRRPSSLDRVNVRRLMIVIRKMLLASTRAFVFEPNDAATWKRVTNAVEPMMADIKSRRGVTNFKVICDETTNTPIRIDRSELWCKVVIQPTKAAEIIVFELNLTSATLGIDLPTS
jgi:phage tail sheath protein FI